MQTTKFKLNHSLPLTCARVGVCCFGNQVLLNPWELNCLAKAKGISAQEFRACYCDLGGTRLRFNGFKDKRNKSACSLYVDGMGCSVHLGRPLACRLFPLGRQVQHNEVTYMHQGAEFPCLDGCSEVLKLPYLTVDAYLKGQQTTAFEEAQDGYLELMQHLADIAFELLLDTGLSASGDRETLRLWRKLGLESPEVLSTRLSQEWLDCLQTPDLTETHPQEFVNAHANLLFSKVQDAFGSLQGDQAFHKASGLVMALALLLASAIGADAKSLMEHWITTAKENGALE